MMFRRSQDLTIKSNIANIPSSQITHTVWKMSEGISLWTDRAKSWIQSAESFVVSVEVLGKTARPAPDLDGRNPEKDGSEPDSGTGKKGITNRPSKINHK